MNQAPTLSDEDELLAAELAFELLDRPERAAAEARLASDPGFAAAHRRWQARAAGLFVGADVAPPAGMWDAIVARLPANDAGMGARRIRRWQLASAAAAVLAVASTTALLLRPMPPPVSPAPAIGTRPSPRPLIAMLASPERPAAVAIGYDPRERRLTVLPSRVAPGGRAAELWVIPAGGIPHTLGVIATDAAEARAPPEAAAPLIVPGATLAITLEPPGGAPHGAPTGPAILTGVLRQS